MTCPAPALPAGRNAPTARRCVSPRFLFRSCQAVLALGLIGLLLTPARATDTASFARQLQADLRRNVERLHHSFAAEREQNRAPSDFYMPYLLSGLTNLHARTGEPVLLEWAKADLLWLVRCSQDKQGRVTPFFGDRFRFLGAFCDAFRHLKTHGALTAAEIAEVEAQIAANAEARMDRADFGAQNRGLIYGAELQFCADALPAAPRAERWRRYGEALTHDSEQGWSVEDASLYEPFWLNHLLTLAELRGTLDERMQRVTTRFYFDQARALQLPNGLLPDWGDADWTESWMWYCANWTLAGSRYRDGTYLDAARRIYEANAAFRAELHLEAVGALGLAVRWLDESVPLKPFTPDRSAEVMEDLLAKKIVFRGAAGSYALLNYRDQGAYGRFTRDYQNAQLAAYEEKPHHGHADENSLAFLMQDGTALLADGGYRAAYARGWRADVYHNRIVARTGFPPEGDVFGYLFADPTYHAVRTEKIHFGTFGSLDYSRTRLVDEERGYTGDRILLFAPENGLTIVVDSLLIDRAGHKVFCNTWHPDQILSQGDNWVLSHPARIPARRQDWPNPHTRELLIEFVGNRDKIAGVREIDRRYNPSQAFYQHLANYFFQGQRLTFVTVLRPLPAGGYSPALLGGVKLITNEHDDGRTLGLSFQLDGEPVTVGLKLDQTIGLTNLRGRPMFDRATGTVAYGPLRTDADFAFVRERRDGRREFGFQYGIGLEYDGRELFLEPVWKEMFQGPGGFAVADRRDKMPRWHETVGADAHPAKK
jgi:hypothetical protein